MTHSITASGRRLLLPVLLTMINPVSPIAIAADLLYPQDFEYLGAFRFPSDGGALSEWPYGGAGLTYYPGGDPDGPADGFPGSLFAKSHKHDDMVGELSIPTPRIPMSYNVSELERGTTLQEFADITGGLMDAYGAYLGTLCYLPRQGSQTTDKIYYTLPVYYNASGDNHLGHAWSDLDISNPHAAGPWHLGPLDDDDYHAVKTTDYTFEIPREWADAHVGGKYLVSGRHRQNGAFGGAQGPSLYAVAPWQEGNPPPVGAELDATILVMYPTGGGYYPDYCAADGWMGGAWLTAGSRTAVLLVGTKGLGEVYYGEGRPGDCNAAKGFHCDPYEAQFIFYDPDQLALVARGQLRPWEVIPYAIWSPEELWPKCQPKPIGAAYDRERNILYVSQYNVDSVDGAKEPIVHVWRVGAPQAIQQGEGPSNPEPSARTSTFAGVSVLPNPFERSTTIRLLRAAASSPPPVARVAIFDVMGRLLTDFGVVSQETIHWDARRAPGGIYFLRATDGQKTVTKKLSLVK